MKRLHLLLYMILVCLGLQAQEAEQGEQLLVFRNTGVVDLLYTNEVDSILTNDTTQVFYAKDTVLVVPIDELDSVAVGSRNEVRMNADARELAEGTDLPWIIRYDEQSIYYRTDTPNDILPVVGMKLFYGLQDLHKEEALFPYGLSVKVIGVTNAANEIRIDVQQVGLDEIFDRLFYAGIINYSKPISDSRASKVRKKEEEQMNPHTFNDNIGIDVSERGSISLNGFINTSGKLLYNIERGRREYYGAELDLDFGFGVGLSMLIGQKDTLDLDRYAPALPIATVLRVINLEGALGVYLDGSVELNVNAEFQRTYHRKLIWRHENGNHTYEVRDLPNPDARDDELKASLTMSGRVSAGVVFRFDAYIAGIRAGGRAKMKLGPELKGELTGGLLSDLRSYNPKLYSDAKVDLSARLKFETFTTHRRLWLRGDVVENKLDYGFTRNIGSFEWRPFPQFQATRAILPMLQREVQAEQAPVVEVATAIPEPPPSDVEIGFDIIDEQGEVIDSIFVGTIEAEPEDTTVAQTFDAEITLPSTIKQENLENYTMRPIFHYAGYTISAAPVGISKDVLLQPYSSTQSNGAMTFISSGPFIGSAVKDSTLYQVGMYLPVPLKNNIYRQGKDKKINLSIPIDDNHGNLLIGTWTGKVNDTDVTLTFTEDGTGEYNNRGFVYSMNEPQSGELLLEFENKETMILRVLSVTETELKLKDKRDKSETIWLLTK